MGAFDGLDIAASGLTAQRFRLDVVSANLANVNTTRTDAGEPFRRQIVQFRARQGRLPGVDVYEIAQDKAPFPRIYDPGNPDADASGYVRMPNVNPVTEMTDLISASRSYEANITAAGALKEMARKALEI
ncbi:MAG: flagellar basal body rod protein FlgC [Candidatus Sericytochromatia bacterium]|nr:flagellar basal body rod protein FlgC [Candidatus Sericytochromatia bacterium]